LRTAAAASSAVICERIITGESGTLLERLACRASA
jgi:hypothetical protein